jgi:hypothetical protein
MRHSAQFALYDSFLKILPYLSKNPETLETLNLELWEYLEKVEKADFLGLLSALRGKVAHIAHEQNPRHKIESPKNPETIYGVHISEVLPAKAAKFYKDSANVKFNVKYKKNSGPRNKGKGGGGVENPVTDTRCVESFLKLPPNLKRRPVDQADGKIKRPKK